MNNAHHRKYTLDEYYNALVSAYNVMDVDYGEISRAGIISAASDPALEEMLVSFISWHQDGRNWKTMPKPPRRPLKDVIGDLTSPLPIEDSFDLDSACFGLKLNWVTGFNDESGYFPMEIYMDGVSKDIRPELQRNRPEVYDAICQAVTEEMEERRHSV